MSIKEKLVEVAEHHSQWLNDQCWTYSSIPGVSNVFGLFLVVDALFLRIVALFADGDQQCSLANSSRSFVLFGLFLQVPIISNIVVWALLFIVNCIKHPIETRDALRQLGVIKKP